METGPDSELLRVISVDQAWYYSIVPLKREDNGLHFIVSSDKDEQETLNELEIILGSSQIILSKEENEKVVQMLNTLYPRKNGLKSGGDKSGPSSFLGVKDTNFLATLINEAGELGSSDIHIEIYSEKCRIRFRVDGVLIDRHFISKSLYPTLINKIKIAASCDIAEKRLPQDGRIRFKFSRTNFDIRVSVLPTLHGEKIVLRLLGGDASQIGIENLGFTDIEKTKYQNAVKKQNGIILISGPTGSGKTTTLYATLKLLNKVSRNILTIEDPIEYTLDGINQVQLKEDIGLNYGEALRTFLRQDPDVIMLGEIRDSETAKMAIRAALTGHLVLSTIHTNSAWGTISRLVDMGIPPYLLSTTINISVAQRLIRTLCESCKVQKEFVPGEVPGKYQNIALKNHCVPKGCENCHFTGFKGRRAIYEILEVNRDLAAYIKDSNTDIEEFIMKNKISTLSDNAFSLFESGKTSLEEIYSYLLAAE